MILLFPVVSRRAPGLISQFPAPALLHLCPVWRYRSYLLLYLPAQLSPCTASYILPDHSRRVCPLRPPVPHTFALATILRSEHGAHDTALPNHVHRIYSSSHILKFFRLHYPSVPKRYRGDCAPTRLTHLLVRSAVILQPRHRRHSFLLHFPVGLSQIPRRYGRSHMTVGMVLRNHVRLLLRLGKHRFLLAQVGTTSI